MSTHQLLGHEIDVDLEPDEIVTGLVVIVSTDAMDGGTETVQTLFSIPTGYVKAQGMIFNAYHASAQSVGPGE